MTKERISFIFLIGTILIAVGGPILSVYVWKWTAVLLVPFQIILAYACIKAAERVGKFSFQKGFQEHSKRAA